MKSKFLAFLIVIILFTACKKDNLAIQHTITSVADLNKIKTMLNGTWSYQGYAVGFQNLSSIPETSVAPFGGSLLFDNQTSSVNRYDYDAKMLTPLGFQLTGEDHINFITVTTPNGIVRKCRIITLSSDSLKLENIITGLDTSKKLIVIESWAKAIQEEVTDGTFRIKLNGNVSNALLYNPGATVTIYVTPKGGTEKTINQQTGVTQNYSYSFRPQIGDHIRMAITTSTGGYPDQIQAFRDNFPMTEAHYKGISFGPEWFYWPVRQDSEHSWDIIN